MAPAALLTDLRAAESRFAHALLAPNTRAAYAADFEVFRKFCARIERPALPASAETLALFVTDVMGTGKITTAARRARGVAWAHKSRGFPSPLDGEVQGILRGAQRLRLERPRQMRPLTVDQLRRIAAYLAARNTRLAVRNRAILITGFASALRRSNLCALDLDDLAFSAEGITVRIRHEKQDQEGRGRFLGLPRGHDALTCPVGAIESWLAYRGHEPGPLFTSCHGGRLGPDALRTIVKRALRAIGEDDDNYACHSMRSGFITAAGQAGVSHLLIAFQSGHRSLATLQRYFRSTDLWKANPAAMIGL